MNTRWRVSSYKANSALWEASVEAAVSAAGRRHPCHHSQKIDQATPIRESAPVKRAAGCRVHLKLICLCAAMLLGRAGYTEEEAEKHANVLVSAESDEGEHDQFTEMGEYG